MYIVIFMLYAQYQVGLSTCTRVRVWGGGRRCHYYYYYYYYYYLYIHRYYKRTSMAENNPETTKVCVILVMYV